VKQVWWCLAFVAMVELSFAALWVSIGLPNPPQSHWAEAIGDIIQSGLTLGLAWAVFGPKKST
jgi:hypothetical protein